MLFAKTHLALSLAQALGPQVSVHCFMWEENLGIKSEIKSVSVQSLTSGKIYRFALNDNIDTLFGGFCPLCSWKHS